MENNRNFFITIALSVLILTLWQVFYMNPKIETQREQARIEQERIAEQKAAQPAGTAAGTGVAQPQASIPGAPARGPPWQPASPSTRRTSRARSI